MRLRGLRQGNQRKQAIFLVPTRTVFVAYLCGRDCGGTRDEEGDCESEAESAQELQPIGAEQAAYFGNAGNRKGTRSHQQAEPDETHSSVPAHAVIDH